MKHTRHTHLHTHDTIYIFQSMFGAQMPPSPVKMTPKRRGMSSTAPPSAHDMLLTPPQPTPNPPEFTKSSLTRRPDVEFRRLGWAVGPRADVLSWAASLILALTRQKSSGSSPPPPPRLRRGGARRPAVLLCFLHPREKTTVGDLVNYINIGTYLQSTSSPFPSKCLAFLATDK